MTSPQKSWPSWNREDMSASSRPSGRPSAPSTGTGSARSPWLRKVAWLGLGLSSVLLAVAIWAMAQPAPAAPKAATAALVPIADQLAWTQALQAWQSGILVPAPQLPSHPGLRTSMETQVNALSQWQAIPARQALLAMLDKIETDTSPWWTQSQQAGEAGPFVTAWATIQGNLRDMRSTLSSQDWLRRSATVEAQRAQVDAALRAFAASPEASQPTSISQVWRLALQAWFADQQQTGWTALAAAQQAWTTGLSDLQGLSQQLVQANQPVAAPAPAPAAPGWPAWLAAGAWVGILASILLWGRSTTPDRGWSEALPQDGLAAHLAALLADAKRIGEGELDSAWTARPTALAPLVDSLNQIQESWRHHVDQAKSLAHQMHQKTCEVGDSQQTMVDQVVVQDRVLADVGEWIRSLHQGAMNAEGELAMMIKEIGGLVNQGVESASHWQKARKGAEKALTHARETAKPLALLQQDMHELHDLGRLLRNISEQLGVLAMQAALQAAKAGDAGKGFQVVAKEVQDAARRAEEASSRVSAIVDSDQANLNTLRTTLEGIEEQADESMKRAEMANDASVGMEEGFLVVKSRSSALETLVSRQSIEAQSVQDKLSEAPLTDHNGTVQNRCAEVVREMIDLARESGENMSKFWSGKST
jgi:methyl-accepting chemotaxis protein